ncbi:protein-tyrosine phosphatase-like protein [Gloeopeniophorella convolvens]|nr:protein-tyrosine phosphatase-like protein [Gloeopeniophorella convolvens]
MRPGRQPAIKHKRVASRIAPRLYLTDLHTACDPVQLTNLGITHVVSAIEEAPTFPASCRLRTLHIPVSDHAGEDILQYLSTTTSFIRGALAESPDARVLVHCYMGISRSATVVIAYLIATSGMAPREALAAVRGKRSIVRPNPGFMSQLETYWVRCSNTLQARIREPLDNRSRHESRSWDRTRARAMPQGAHHWTGTRNDSESPAVVTRTSGTGSRAVYSVEGSIHRLGTVRCTGTISRKARTGRCRFLCLR